MLNHIIWDWNGTLLDDAWLCNEIINKLLEDNYLPKITLDEYKEHFDFPVKKYYENIGFDFDLISFEKLSDIFISEYNRRKFECKLQKDAERVIKFYYEKNIPQSILSARQHTDLIEDLEHYNLRKYFKFISGLDNHYAAGKIENGKKLIDKIGENPKDIIFIGDTTHDFDVAKALKTGRIAVSIGHHSEKKLKKNNVVIYDNLLQVVFPYGE